nr:SurA N-terminal domain-containing protein [uncultured Haemophilus sp.]
MIEKWHERTNSVGFKIIFSLVSLSFVLAGIGGGIVGANTSAVKVNGQEISQREFSDAKNRQQSILYNQMGAELWDQLDDPKFANEFNQSVLNSLVNDALLRQYIDELKLGVSVDQIKSEIVHSPNFQQNGKFDNNLYQQTLRNAGLTADGYAQIVGQGILYSQMEDGVINSSFNVPAQEETLAKLLFQKRQVRLASYSLANEIQKQTASSEELQAFYDKHKAQLLAPEQFVVEYISLPAKELEKKVQITDEQIETYYDKNKAQYVTKGESQLAHIQVANETDAQAIEQQLKNGADFATLAKEKSLDKLSANKGGDLGWAKAGTFPADFEKAADALQVGQVSQPVKMGNEYHIIKVLDRKPETVLPLEKVKESIANTLRHELVGSEYSTVTRAMATSAYENAGSLDAVAKVGGVEVKTTPMFTRETLPAELNNDAITKVLFNGELAQSGQNSEAIEVGDENAPRTMFIRVKQYQPEREKTLDEAKPEVEAMVKREKAESALLAQADNQVKALNGDKNDVAFGGAQTLVYVQAQAEQPAFAKAVFSLAKPTDKPTYGVARNAQGDVLLVALDKVEDGTLAEFKPLQTQFAEANRTTLRADLINDLRERASIDVNEEFMQQLISPAQ